MDLFVGVKPNWSQKCQNETNGSRDYENSAKQVIVMQKIPPDKQIIPIVSFFTKIPD